MISPTPRHLANNIQKSQETDIVIPAGFESAVPARERPQTHALDRAITGSAEFNWATLNIIDTAEVLTSDSSSGIRQYSGWESLPAPCLMRLSVNSASRFLPINYTFSSELCWSRSMAKVETTHCLYNNASPVWIRSNEMQQYAGVYLLQNYSTCFGCLSNPSSGVHKTVTAASGTGHITYQSNNLPPAWPNYATLVEGCSSDTMTCTSSCSYSLMHSRRWVR